MSKLLNVIENANLNIVVNDDSSPVASKDRLYDFARGELAKAFDDVLGELKMDGDVELDSLTIDLEVNADGDVFKQIADLLRSALKSKLGMVMFKKQSMPITNLLANVYRRHLPMEKSSNLENRFNTLAEAWFLEHPGQKFNPLAFSESVIKIMRSEFPNVDVQQVAYVVYQNILQLKNAKNSQAAENPSANDSASTLNSNATSFEVVDSGLVLLSPYIPALFERTGCVEKGVFHSDDAKRKALAVLKFAAYGTYSEPPRNAAVMNILCGLPVTPAFDADELPKISDSEKELVEGLLKAVIANWKAVGHMSPDGLRGAYFVRNGTVETSGMADMLTIETKTYDILLDKLPWGYSTIKHPWMKKVLNVKWR